jgi:hypothetical protein
MKSLIWVVLAHIVGVVALIGLGLLLNEPLKANTYGGVTTVLSTAFGIYCFVVNILYHKNQRVFLWVNRLLLLVRRTHTYWLPAFDFTLSDASLANRREVINEVEKALAALPHKKIQRTNDTPSSAAITVDETFFFVLRLDESHLHVTLDRKTLVPAHLYEAYRQRLARFAEVISNAVHPESVRLGITITFGDGVSNPYFGFFVQRVPSQLLRHFEASFVLAHASSCRIEAGTDSINIESQGAVDFFEALSQVLAIKAIPTEGVSP